LKRTIRRYADSRFFPEMAPPQNDAEFAPVKICEF